MKISITVSFLGAHAAAFAPMGSLHCHRRRHDVELPQKTSLRLVSEEKEGPADGKSSLSFLPEPQQSRRDWIFRTALIPLLGFASSTLTIPLVGDSNNNNNNVAHALVKGVAPPPPKSKSSDKPKCTNVEECQAQAAKRQEEEALAALENADPPKTTPGGTRYRDILTGEGRAAKDGDQVTLSYKVLKLGKRSYDGLSGEGTVVFSRGYGLEDDEKVPGDKTFVTTIGNPTNILALNEAVAGMLPGGVRRFSVFPTKGWRKPGSACDGGPGGSGAGGEIRTDYVVVPTATMVQEETCFDMSKKPFPVSYAQQRRMAQRFDQSLIMEVTLVGVSDGV